MTDATDLEDPVTRLSVYVKALPEELPEVEKCLEEATDLVDDYIGSWDVKDSKRTRAILEVGAALYDRKQARNGSSGFDGVDVATLSAPKDPMRLAYPILNLPGIA